MFHGMFFREFPALPFWRCQAVPREFRHLMSDHQKSVRITKRWWMPSSPMALTPFDSELIGFARAPEAALCLHSPVSRDSGKHGRQRMTIAVGKITPDQAESGRRSCWLMW
jgi:hypothetical protein